MSNREKGSIYAVDSMALLQSTYTKGIFSHTTALHLHSLTDRIPLNYTITLPFGYHAQSLSRINLICVYVKQDLWNIGIINIKNAFGETVKTYNKERTICDIVKKRNSMDMQILTDALRQYCCRKDKNLLLLNKYAKIFRIERILRAYLEVLL